MTNELKRKSIDWGDDHPATYSDMLEVAQRYYDDGDKEMGDKICDVIEVSMKEQGYK